MDASVFEPAARAAVGLCFFFVPRAHIWRPGGHRLDWHGAHAGAFLFKVQRIGLAVFAALLGFIALLLLVIAVAGRSADASLAARFNEGIGYVYWFVLKVAVFMYLFIWYRATWPRYRFDQLMRVGWKVLLPISLGVLVVTAIVGVLVS